MDVKRNFQKSLYAVGYTDSGRYIGRKKVTLDEEANAIQSIYDSYIETRFVKLEEHYEPV